MSNNYDNAFNYSARPVEEARYEEIHRELYPGQWPDRTQALYDSYSNLKAYTNRTKRRYNNVALAHGATPLANDEYGLVGVSNIERRGHAALIGPAEDGATAHLRTARLRHRFLAEEEYAYQTLNKRREHEQYAVDHYDLAADFRNRLALHRREAVSPPLPIAGPSSDTRSRSRARSVIGSDAVGSSLRSRSRSRLRSHSRPAAREYEDTSMGPMYGPSYEPPVYGPVAPPPLLSEPVQPVGRFRRIGGPSSSVISSAPSMATDGPGSVSGFQFSMRPGDRARSRSRVRSSNVFDRPVPSPTTAERFARPGTPYGPSGPYGAYGSNPLPAPAYPPLDGRPAPLRNMSAIQPLDEIPFVRGRSTMRFEPLDDDAPSRRRSASRGRALSSYSGSPRHRSMSRPRNRHNRDYYD